MRTTAAALLLLLPLAACSSDDGGDDPVVAAPTSAAAPTAAAPTAADSAAPATAATIVLRADGITLRTATGDQAIRFGAGTGVVVPALAAALGEPQQQSVACGQGARTDVGAKGFDVLFDGDRFVGWDESGAGLATEQGLKLGSTKADVQKAFPTATFTKSSLGDEFLVSEGGLAGFLDGAAPTSTVVGLTGGEACVAR